MKKITGLIVRHKVKIFIFLIVAVGGAYYYYKSKGSTEETRYILSKAEKGAIIVSVTGSGQMSASDEIELKPKVSAQIKEVRVKTGQKVKAGDILVKLDTNDLSKALRSAKNSLDSARNSLLLKLEPITAQDLKISENSVKTAKQSYDNSLSSLDEAKRTASDNLKTAESALQSAQISFDSAKKSYDNSIASGDITTSGSSDTLSNAYLSAKNNLNTSLISLRNGLIQADSYLAIEHTPANAYLKDVLGVKNSGALNTAKASYYTAKASIESFEKEYDRVSANWTHSGIDSLLQKALTAFEDIKDLHHNTHSALLNSITSANVTQTNLDSYLTSESTQESSAITSISTIQSAIQTIKNAKTGISSTDISVSGTLNSAKVSYVNTQNSLKTAKDNLEKAKLDNAKNIASAESDIKSKKISYENAVASHELKISAPSALEVASSRISVNQAYESYLDALDDMKSAEVVSPIDGVISVISQKTGDSASPATPIMTIITENRLAKISFNEVDAAKIKTGQKATFTFNAIEGLSLTGIVAEVDQVGTVTQNVVNYTVTLALDSQDKRIKPEMSVSVSIITQQKLDALLVPASAVKTDTSASYVEIMKDVADPLAFTTGITSKTGPEKAFITTGLADDTNMEVIDGLSEGDAVVIRTSNGTQAKTTTQTGSSQRSGMGIMGMPR